MGFAAQVTQRSGDGGIDAILTDADGRTIGVQVKRSANTISAEQIRAFLGALVNRGHAEGIFFTTSDFTSGAQREAQIATNRGYPIELVNGDAFYEAIGIRRLDSPHEVLHGLPNVYDTRRLWRIPLV